MTFFLKAQHYMKQAFEKLFWIFVLPIVVSSNFFFSHFRGVLDIRQSLKKKAGRGELGLGLGGGIEGLEVLRFSLADWLPTYHLLTVLGGSRLCG